MQFTIGKHEKAPYKRKPVEMAKTVKEKIDEVVSEKASVAAKAVVEEVSPVMDEKIDRIKKAVVIGAIALAVLLLIPKRVISKGGKTIYIYGGKNVIHIS